MTTAVPRTQPAADGPALGPALSVREVVKRYPNGVLAVDGMSLTVRPGERLVLMGPSGSGKSTLLRLIAGLESPDAGSIDLHGRPASGVPPWKRGVAFVSQADDLWPHRTVRGNLTLGLRRAERRGPRWDAIVTALGVEPLLSRWPRTLSGGQRKRVALARALAQDRPILLLDEPLVHLDEPTRRELHAFLLQQPRGADQATLHVTHEPHEARELADRLAVLADGKLLQVGPPTELLGRPANRRVAQFLRPGTYGVLRGALRIAASGGAQFRCAAGTLELRPGVGQEGEGREVDLGVAADELEIHQSEEDGTGLRAAVEAIDTDPLAGHQVRCRHEGGTLLVSTRSPLSGIDIGRDVSVRVKGGCGTLFDAETDVALAHAVAVQTG